MRSRHTHPWKAAEPADHAGEHTDGRVRAVVAGVDPLSHLAPIVMDEREIEATHDMHSVCGTSDLGEPGRPLLPGSTAPIVERLRAKDE